MKTNDVNLDSFGAAMGTFASGITVITTIDADGAPQAITATAFSSVSRDPALCLACIHKRSRAYAPLIHRRLFAVNVLGAGQEWLSTHFASSAPDRFANVAWRPGPTHDCPLLEGALAWLECEIVSVYSGGDHGIILGHPDAVCVSEGTPLVYWRRNYFILPSHANSVGLGENNAAPSARSQRTTQLEGQKHEPG